MKLFKKLLPLLLSSSIVLGISSLKPIEAKAHDDVSPELIGTAVYLSKIRKKLCLFHSLLIDPNTLMDDAVRQ
jgi:hypothetical protein